jgi:dTDP-4-amino-4,6-dideoxygalactose transaminase
MIFISRTKLPELRDYVKQIKRIWESNWLTNDGKLVQELEEKLKKYWGVKHVVCVSSGTSALQIAIKALGFKKVYTHPYSFIATVEAPVWLGVKPIFIDSGKPLKSPALTTHVYGIPHLTNASPVIYDASHAFTTKVNGRSILNYGDVSIISFHAVKIFQTVEGGALVTNNDKIAKKARWMRNHGFKTNYEFYGGGINAKMSEFHAAMGLCALPMVEKIRARFDELITRYNEAFGYNHEGVTYYPIWYSSEKKVLRAIRKFEKNGIVPRRYFYPPLNKVFGGKRCPIAEDSMSRVLCLPLYYDLKKKEQDLIIKIAKETNELLG